MSFYVEKVSRKSGACYRIVRDYTRGGERKREYQVLPQGTTKAQAEKIRCQMELEAEFGAYTTKEPVTLKNYAEEVYFPKYTNSLSPTTRQHYRQLFYTKDGIAKHLGNRYLSEITTEAIQDMVNRYASAGKSAKTIRNIVNLVSVILKRAKIDNYLKRDIPNPCEYVMLPKAASKEGNAYSMEEVKLMMERAKSAGNINIQLLLALTCLAGGLRRSELAALRWEDVTLGEKESFLCVRRAAVYADGKMTEKETKTKAGTRVIPIQPGGEVYRILQTARKMYVKEQSREDDFQGQGHVFILHHAPFAPVSDNRMYKIYKSFLEKECPDLPHYRLHDLRHTYFTLCTEIGFSELSIIATGGHSTIQSTKRYQHATMNRMKSDMAKLEEIFGNTRAASQ